MERTIKYLGSGLSADVYLVEKNQELLAKKIFNPSSLAKIAYTLLYQSRHPYTKEKAIHTAFWRRRIASRIS